MRWSNYDGPLCSFVSPAWIYGIDTETAGKDRTKGTLDTSCGKSNWEWLSSLEHYTYVMFIIILHLSKQPSRQLFRWDCCFRCLWPASIDFLNYSGSSAEFSRRRAPRILLTGQQMTQCQVGDHVFPRIILVVQDADDESVWWVVLDLRDVLAPVRGAEGALLAAQQMGRRSA